MHANIVQLEELIREDDSSLYFVFEYMQDGDLYDLMKQVSRDRSQGIPNSSLDFHRIKRIAKQVLSALDHIHSFGYSHRDIKPENILLDGNTCKIADFGLSRQMKKSPYEASLTEYISTRWYRSPEILLRDSNYSTPIDIFAFGCVMAEMVTLKPLFPGKNEIDQIHKIVQILGAPSLSHWPNGMKLIQELNIGSLLPIISFHADDPFITRQNVRKNLEFAIPSAPPEFISITHQMLHLDPRNRPTAGEILNAGFFSQPPSRETFSIQSNARISATKEQFDVRHRFSPQSTATVVL